jgi:hypothetical protein
VSQDTGAAAGLAALSRALDRIEAARIARQDGGDARVTVGLDQLGARAVKMREAEVLRIRIEEGLALAPLAELTGMSKARAGQIVQEEKRRQEQEAGNG